MMGRTYWHTIYIDRDPNDPYRGWGWVEVTVEDCKRFGIPLGIQKPIQDFAGHLNVLNFRIGAISHLEAEQARRSSR